MLNEYLKRLGNYTTKNFRTWGANTELIRSLLDDNDLTQSVDMVAQKLHHTSAICKKNYIDPKLIENFMNEMKNSSKHTFVVI